MKKCLGLPKDHGQSLVKEGAGLRSGYGGPYHLAQVTTRCSFAIGFAPSTSGCSYVSYMMWAVQFDVLEAPW